MVTRGICAFILLIAASNGCNAYHTCDNLFFEMDKNSIDLVQSSKGYWPYLDVEHKVPSIATFYSSEPMEWTCKIFETEPDNFPRFNVSAVIFRPVIIDHAEYDIRVPVKRATRFWEIEDPMFEGDVEEDATHHSHDHEHHTHHKHTHKKAECPDQPATSNQRRPSQVNEIKMKRYQIKLEFKLPNDAGTQRILDKFRFYDLLLEIVPSAIPPTSKLYSLLSSSSSSSKRIILDSTDPVIFYHVPARVQASPTDTHESVYHVPQKRTPAVVTWTAPLPYVEKSVCSFCKKKTVSRFNGGTLLPCGHVVHNICLQEFKKESFKHWVPLECPICNARLKRYVNRPIYYQDIYDSEIEHLKRMKSRIRQDPSEPINTPFFNVRERVLANDPEWYSIHDESSRSLAGLKRWCSLTDHGIVDPETGDAEIVSKESTKNSKRSLTSLLRKSRQR